MKRSEVAAGSEAGELPEMVRRRVMEKFEEQRLTSENVEVQRARSASHLWTRMTVLICHLERLSETRRYAELLNDSADYKLLRRRYAALAKKASPCLKLGRDHAEDDAVVLLLREFMDQLRDFEVQTYEVLSKLILESGRTEAMRRGCIRELGLTPPEVEVEQRTVTVDVLVLIFLASVMFMGVTAQHLGASRILMIVLAQLAAALVVVGIANVRGSMFPEVRIGREVPRWVTTSSPGRWRSSPPRSSPPRSGR